MTEAVLYATATSLALLVAGPLTGFVSDRVLIPCASLISLVFRETRGRNVYADPRRPAAG